MTDIAARLRTWTDGNEPTAKEREAADEIGRLRAALQDITNLYKTDPANPFLADNMDRLARAALEQKP